MTKKRREEKYYEKEKKGRKQMERKESETTFIIKIRSLRSLKLPAKSKEVKNELSCESNWQIIDLTWKYKYFVQIKIVLMLLFLFDSNLWKVRELVKQKSGFDLINFHIYKNKKL